MIQQPGAMIPSGAPALNLSGPPFGDTVQVGGARFGWPNPAALNPVAFGPVFNNLAPVAQLTGPTYTGVDAMTPNNSQKAASIASGSPLSLSKSPLVWTILALVGGVAAYHYLAYHESGIKGK